MERNLSTEDFFSVKEFTKIHLSKKNSFNDVTY